MRLSASIVLKHFISCSIHANLLLCRFISNHTEICRHNIKHVVTTCFGNKAKLRNTVPRTK